MVSTVNKTFENETESIIAIILIQILSYDDPNRFFVDLIRLLFRIIVRGIIKL